MAGFNACGTIYLKRLTGSNIDPAYWGGAGALNAINFSVTDSSEITKRTSRQIGSCGSTLDSYATGNGATITLGTDEIEHRQMLALLLRGVDSTVTQSETAAPTESVTASIANGQGYWIKLAYQPIKAASVTVTTDPAGTTYVEGTDYEIDYNLGMFRPIAGGGISDSEALLIDYTYTAITGGWEIAGGTQSSIKVAIEAVFLNKVTGKYMRFTAPQVTFSGDATIGLISDDFANAEITGELEIATGETYPYKLTYMG